MTKHLAKTLTLALSTLLFVACKPATVAEPESAPSKPVAATKSVNIGASNYMTIPGHWNIKPSIMPKGFVSYTIKDNNPNRFVSTDIITSLVVSSENDSVTPKRFHNLTFAVSSRSRTPPG